VSSGADRARRLAPLVPVAALLVAGAACPALPPRRPVPPPVHAVVGANVRVTGDRSGSYAAAEGKSDAVTRGCGNARLPQNEPTVAVDPRAPNVVVAGANDLCGLAGGMRGPWVGYYRSVDGGRTWADSLVPGYPGDLAPPGASLPAGADCTGASDPTVAFDNAGRVFFGFICFDPKGHNEGLAIVSTWDADGAHFVGSALAGGAPPEGSGGSNEDKIDLTVDRSGGPRDGTVYVAYAQFDEHGDSTIMVTSSPDHGRSFSAPVQASSEIGQFADLSVAPDGDLYLAYRSFTGAFDEGGDEGGLGGEGEGGDDDRDPIELARSGDGGATFAPPTTIATGTPFDSEGFSGTTHRRDCGDGHDACSSGFTFPRFVSFPAVVADGTGVHVIWNAELGSGQSKVFVRNSADGAHWKSPPVQIDDETVGHQFFPAIASAGGILTAAFYDTRSDASYSPARPPCNTAGGTNPGPCVDVYAAHSADGGRTWTEERVTSASGNTNWEIDDGFRVPFIGDYIGVAATPGRAIVVWTDSRDIVPGRDPDEHGDRDDHDGFDVDLASCSLIGRACLFKGGLDQNVYGAALRS
jgi:hypothetical protein